MRISGKKGYVLTDADVRALAGVILQQRAATSRPGDYVDLDEQQGSDVYVIAPPSGGIPARSGSTPGVAKDCQVYRLVPGLSPSLERVPGLVKAVYNLSPGSVRAPWVRVAKDKYGFWWCDAESATEEDELADPNVPADCGGCGWMAGMQEGMCLFVTELYRQGSCACLDYVTTHLSDLTTYDVASSGDGQAWVASGGVLWTSTLTEANPDSASLDIQGWADLLAAIPDDAEVLGLTLGFTGCDGDLGGVSHVKETKISLLVGGAEAGTNKSTGATWVACPTGTVRSYGGTADIWGLPTLTGPQIKDSGFGFRVEVSATDDIDAATALAKVTQIGLRVDYRYPVPPIDHAKLQSDDGHTWTNRDDPLKTVTVCGAKYAVEFRLVTTESGKKEGALVLVGGVVGSGPSVEFPGVLAKCKGQSATFTFADPELCTNPSMYRYGPLGNSVCLEVAWGLCYPYGPIQVECAEEGRLSPETFCVIQDGRTQINPYGVYPVGSGTPLGVEMWGAAESTGAPGTPVTGFGCFGICTVGWASSSGVGGSYVSTSGGDCGSATFISEPPVQGRSYWENCGLIIDETAATFPWSPETGCNVVPTTVIGGWGDYKIPRTLNVVKPAGTTCFDAQPDTLVYYPGLKWQYSITGEYDKLLIGWDGDWYVSNVANVTNLEVSLDPFLLEFDFTITADVGDCLAGTYHVMVTE